LLFLAAHATLVDLHSFPTRRSSDLFAKSSMDARERELFETAQKIYAEYQAASRQALVYARDGDAERLLSQAMGPTRAASFALNRSEEHTSELQSRENLVCRLLLEKK